MPTCFLCGDVMTGRGIDQILAHPVDPVIHESFVKDARQYVELAERKSGDIPASVEDSYIWGFGLEVLRRQEPDARIINLETAVTNSDDVWKGKGINYRMSPQNAGCLTAAEIDCCTLANNHVLDWGYAGLSETLKSLGEAGLKTIGAGEDLNAAQAPAAVPADDGSRFLVFGLSSPDSGVPGAWSAGDDRAGVWLLPDFSDDIINRVAGVIATHRESDSDIVIVSIHWGSNWGYEIPAEQRRFARRLIDEAGVSIIHGHSSHHVKGVEVHKGGLILYGCGDLITDYEGIRGREEYRGDLSLMYFPEVDAGSRRLKSLRMQPTHLHRMQLQRPSSEDATWLQNVLNREGEDLGTQAVKTEDDLLELRWSE